ncbi:MAG: hypothetical protein WCK46_02080 [Candidatus Adlerbacteria bacterium]
MIPKQLLVDLYSKQGLSSAQIAKREKCSATKIDYWLSKYEIPKRSISDAIYKKRNPKGDPFLFQKPKTISTAILYGLGIGLYWGEGTKRSKNSVRLGNSDPFLIRKFIQFLEVLYSIDIRRLKFGLQIFGDMNGEEALTFWIKSLKAKREQFYAPIITPHRGVGNYRRKTKYGVLTLYFNNKKLRDIICSAIDQESR